MKGAKERGAEKQRKPPSKQKLFKLAPPPSEDDEPSKQGSSTDAFDHIPDFGAPVSTNTAAVTTADDFEFDDFQSVPTSNTDTIPASSGFDDLNDDDWGDFQ